MERRWLFKSVMRAFYVANEYGMDKCVGYVSTYDAIRFLQEAVDLLEIECSLQHWLGTTSFEADVELRSDIRHGGVARPSINETLEECRWSCNDNALHHHVTSRYAYTKLVQLVELPKCNLAERDWREVGLQSA